MVKRSRWFGWRLAAIAWLALTASLGGLLWPEGEADEGAREVTSIRGESVELYGRGLYGDDSLFIGAGNRGTDFVVLVLGLPLLVLAAASHRRGSLRGALLLAGVLAFFLYVYASYAIGVAYNDLFLVYVGLLSAASYAFVWHFSSFDLGGLQGRLQPGLPRRGLAVFMFASGAVTLAVWLAPILTALIEGGLPERLDTYTTRTTDALDLAIITPATIITGALVLRGAAAGYLMACSLLVLEAMLAPLIVAQTVSQLDAGVSFPAGQIAGPIAGFAALAATALWFLAQILRHVSEGDAGDPGGGRSGAAPNMD